MYYSNNPINKIFYKSLKHIARTYCIDYICIGIYNLKCIIILFIRFNFQCIHALCKYLL